MEAARERAAAFERRRRGLRELSELTQEFGGYDRVRIPPIVITPSAAS